MMLRKEHFFLDLRLDGRPWLVHDAIKDVMCCSLCIKYPKLHDQSGRFAAEMDVTTSKLLRSNSTKAATATSSVVRNT